MLVRVLASLLLLSSAVAFNVNADNHSNGIKYTFAEIRFVDVDGGDGIEFGGSYQFNEKFYGIASIQDLDIGSINLDTLEIGGGYIYPYKKFDLALELSLLDADASGTSESGYSLSAGGRGYLTPELEFRGYIKRIDLDQLGSDTFVELGGDYFLGSELSIGLTLEVASEADTLTFGGRYYFK